MLMTWFCADKACEMNKKIPYLTMLPDDTSYCMRLGNMVPFKLNNTHSTHCALLLNCINQLSKSSFTLNNNGGQPYAAVYEQQDTNYQREVYQ